MLLMVRADINLAAAQREKRDPNTRHADQLLEPVKKEGEESPGAKSPKKGKNNEKD